MIRVTMKDGRTFEGELFDRQYDAYKREGWFTLDVNYSRNPEVPEIFLFEECVCVVDLAQPDVDLLPSWTSLVRIDNRTALPSLETAGWVTYKTSPVRMESVEPHTGGPLHLFPTRNTCPICHVWDGVTFTSVEERFPYGAAPHTVELTAIVERGHCKACTFEFTDVRAEVARDLAVQEYLRTKESP